MALSCGQYTAKPRIGRMTEDRPHRFANERWSGGDYSASIAYHIAKGENVVVRPLPTFWPH